MSVTLHTTLGDLKLELFCREVPKLTENFLALCASGTYNMTLFHRNVAGFMVQGGDPTGTGKGGECIWGGLLPDEFSPTLSHSSRGIVSFANNGPHANGAQFFITYAAAQHLDNKFSIIGQVIGGEVTLALMEAVPVSGKKSKPVEDIRIQRVTVHVNPFASGTL
jgi:peptidyl-prolyl cis-trans isomerase-like 3